MVDSLFGGNGGLVKNGSGTPELLDYRPRGSYPGNCAPGTATSAGGGSNVDPCSWFEMTGTDVADVAAHQHHQGTDWMYGGWDRDVMEGDVTGNGPNNGDRMIDWPGAFNLFLGCNSAYGGFNDVRELSPQMQNFLQEWAYGAGAGPTLADVTTKARSGYTELGMVYTSDMSSNVGPAYPTTPGHFEQFSCAP